MEGIEAIIALAGKLGGAGFATLLTVILWGSWQRVWVWGRELVKATADHAEDIAKLTASYEKLLAKGDEDVAKLTAGYEKLLAKEQEQGQWWRDIAIKATGIAELQGTVVARELAKTTAEPSGRS